MRRSIVASGLLALASRAYAQVASVSPTSDVTFKLNIPADTASAGTGDIFFQLSAPSTYEWVALGLGSRMSGSNIFVVYTSSGGKNVTVSPRLASSYNPPNYNSDAQFTLLEGSGVSNGKMVANVKCSNCNSWTGGSVNFKDATGNWVYAYQSSGGPKNSDDKSASINQHNKESAFSWSYANAKGGNSVNPLVNAAPAGTASGTVSQTSCVPRPTSGVSVTSSRATATNAAATVTQSDDDDRTTATTSTRRTRSTAIPSDFRSRFATPTGAADNEKRDTINYCDDSQNTETGFVPILSSAQANMNKRLAAHAILAALAFVIFFPAGAIAMRLASFPFVVAFHAAFQLFAYLVYIAAFGLGVVMANDLQVLRTRHPIIGIVVFVLLFIQPFLGFIHHALFKKHHTRTLVSHFHIWLGRSIIVLGIVNGGLGFQLADQLGMGSKSGKIAYSVLAAIFGVAWIAAIVIGERRRAKRSPSNPSKETEIPAAEGNTLHGHYAPK